MAHPFALMTEPLNLKTESSLELDHTTGVGARRPPESAWTVNVCAVAVESKRLEVEDVEGIE